MVTFVEILVGKNFLHSPWRPKWSQLGALIQRRNQCLAMLMFFSQINQQIDQWRQRRAWLWLSPKNWFCHLLTSRALNFLWKEHFRVTRETFEYLWDFVRLNLEKQHMRFRSPVSVKKKHILHCGDWQQVTAMEVVDCNFCLGRRVFTGIEYIYRVRRIFEFHIAVGQVTLHSCLSGALRRLVVFSLINNYYSWTQRWKSCMLNTCVWMK